MIRALKVVMIVYSLMLVAWGVLFVFAPEQSLRLMGMSGATNSVKYFMAGLGVTLFSIGVWAIVAARDVLRNLMVLKILITCALLATALYIGSVAAGWVDFSNVLMGILMDGVFTILFLVLYPWKAKQTAAQAPKAT